MKKNVKNLLLFLLCGVMCFGLAACGGGSGKTGGDAGKTSKESYTMTIWTTGDVGINPQIEVWNESHPDRQIEMVTAESEALLANLQTALAAGAGLPDAVWVESDSVENFKRNPELWVNLFDYGAKELEGDYLEWKWEQALSTEGDFLFGLPTDVGPILMAYRIDIFEAAGLPADRDEVSKLLVTWDDYVSAGEAIKEKTGSYMVNNAAYLFQVIVGQGEQKFFDTEENLVVGTNRQVSRAWDMAQKVVKSGISANMQLWSSEWSTALGDGTIAVQLCPAWMMTHIKNYSEENAGKWDFAYLPEGGGNWGGSFACIPAKAEHPEAMYDFISGALSTEGQFDTFVSNKLFPSAVGVYEMDEFKNSTDEFFNNAPFAQMFSESAQQLIPAYEGIYSKDVLEIMKDAASRFENGTQTPDKSWQQAMDEIARLMR